MPPVDPEQPSPLSTLRRAAARCWTLLLVRIYECRPLRCPNCGEPMRVTAFVLDRPTVERILAHIGVIGGRVSLPTEKQRLPPVGHRPIAPQPPAALPARSPPQLSFGFDQTPAPTTDRPEMDQTAGQADGWE